MSRSIYFSAKLSHLGQIDELRTVLLGRKYTEISPVQAVVLIKALACVDVQFDNLVYQYLQHLYATQQMRQLSERVAELLQHVVQLPSDDSAKKAIIQRFWGFAEKDSVDLSLASADVLRGVFALHPTVRCFKSMIEANRELPSSAIAEFIAALSEPDFFLLSKNTSFVSSALACSQGDVVLSCMVERLISCELERALGFLVQYLELLKQNMGQFCIVGKDESVWRVLRQTENYIAFFVDQGLRADDAIALFEYLDKTLQAVVSGGQAVEDLLF